MKKTFTLGSFILALLLAVAISGSAQNIYWGAGQGFENVNGGHINSTSSLIPAGPAADTADWGTIWILYQAYRTASSPAVCAAYGAGHIRFPKLAVGVEPWASTPDLGFGVNTISFVNASTTAGKVFTLQYTTGQYNDTAAYAVQAATWTTFAKFKISASCKDTTITLNQLSARRIRFFSDTSTLAYQTDFDSVLITSVNTITPVTFGGINAIASNGSIKVNWSIQTATNTQEYIVERSGDGKSFESIGTLGANGAANYNWIDNAPLGGTNFYKVEAIGVSGEIQYSTVVSASLNNDLTPQVVVAPNPVRTGQFNLELENFAKGNYTLSIYSTSGQQILSSVISHPGGTSSQPITLPAVAKGLYNVHIGNFNKTIVVE